MCHNNFDSRVDLTKIIEDKMVELFENETTHVHTFGCDTIAGEDGILWDYLKRPEVNQQAAAMIVKFSPDFILVKHDEQPMLYFVDVKHSVSPVWADSRLNKIRGRNGDTSISNSKIGVIAREALLSYRRYYPNTIVLMASPYNSKVLMAQFAKDIRCLYCYKKDGEYNCADCPSDNGGFFDIERATNSVGSQTPMTDVDLDSFLPADTFFEQLGIVINRDVLDELIRRIKQEPIMFGSENVNQDTINKVLYRLNRDGCDWVDYKVYSKEGNDFIHLNRNCFCLSGEGDIIEHRSLAAAQSAGLIRTCNYCFRNI